MEVISSLHVGKIIVIAYALDDVVRITFR